MPLGRLGDIEQSVESSDPKDLQQWFTEVVQHQSCSGGPGVTVGIDQLIEGFAAELADTAEIDNQASGSGPLD